MASICHTYEQAGVRAIPKHNQELCPQDGKNYIQILPFEDKSTYGQKLKSHQRKQLSHINKKCSENKKLSSQSESSKFQNTQPL